MSDTEKVHELFESFVNDFLHPLFTGEKVAQQTRPLPPGVLEHFSFARPADPDVEEAILRSMLDIASEISPVDHLPFPEHGAMATALALHNLCSLTDPLLDRTFSRGARPTILSWIDELIDSIGLPQTRGEALARHAILSRFLMASREDTVVKNWAYTYRFYGRPPPANVVALPRLRFVKQEHTKKTLVSLWHDEEELDLATRFRALLSRSPVSELLHSELAPELQFGTASLAVLSDASLRHGIVQAIVKAGTGNIAQPFGHALRLLSSLGAPPRYLYAAAAFLVELQLLEVLDERAGHQPRSEPAVGDEELFSAVLPALLQHEGALSHLLELNEVDRALIEERAELRRRQSGDDAVEFALTILNRARPLSGESSAPPSHDKSEPPLPAAAGDA